MHTADTTAGFLAGSVTAAHRLSVQLVRTHHRLEITTPALSLTGADPVRGQSRPEVV